MDDQPNTASGNVTGSLINRRQILLLALAVSFGAFILRIYQLLSSFLWPPVRANGYGGIVHAGELAHIPLPADDPVHIAEGRFWLVHGPEGLSALHSSCTHLNCLFTWDTDKQVFVCPCHGSEFSKNGLALKGPAERSLDRFPIRLLSEDNEVVRESDTDQAHSIQVIDLLHPEPLQDTSDGTPIPDQKRISIQVDTGHKIGGSISSSRT